MIAGSRYLSDCGQLTIKHPKPQILSPGGKAQASIIVDPDVADAERGTEAKFAVAAFIDKEIVGGINRTLTKMAFCPPTGETGRGKTIKIQWSYGATSDPIDPPFIEYRIHAFTAPVPPLSKKKAILVGIENTGSLLFEMNISDQLKDIIEKFVDKIDNAKITDF